MAQEKDKPTVETVQEAVKVSDLLMYEVCKPLKDQLDKIEICRPAIVTCLPNKICKPSYTCIPSKLCSPVFSCVPKLGCFPNFCVPSNPHCVPNVQICQPDVPEICTPSAGKPWDLEDLATSAELLKEKLLVSDYTKLQAEVERLKAEVDALKKRLR